MNQYQEFVSTEDLAIMPAETQLREDLADAMRESPRDSRESPRDSGELFIWFFSCSFGFGLWLEINGT